MLSIIIPSLNEEKFLPKLLESIKKQKLENYEIIVADAGSEDRTVEIAKQYGCLVVPGGLPAKGRNEGAKAAKGDLLFFLDADTVLPDNFFEDTLKEFNARALVIASFCLWPSSGDKISEFFIDIFYNKYIILLENILPHTAVGILAKKEIFQKLGGFDEELKLAEDHYLGRQAKKLYGARPGIIRSAKILVSDRRFKTDGWATIGIKYLLCELHMIFWGPVKSDIFRYRFNHYKK